MVQRGNRPKNDEAKLRQTISVLKAETRALLKQNQILRDELKNIMKPVRKRRPHRNQKSPKKMTEAEWKRYFIQKYKPRIEKRLKELGMDKKLVRVVLESPFAGDVESNIAYARRCVKDCLLRGEAPLASHLLYIQEGILDDTKPEERKLGMNAGFVWNELAERVVVYTDRGVSKGMEAGVALAQERGIPVEYRKLGE